MRGLELPEAGGVAEGYLSASGPATLRVRQGHQAAQAEAPHHSRLHRSGWSGLTLCSRLSRQDIKLEPDEMLILASLREIDTPTGHHPRLIGTPGGPGKGLPKRRNV